MAQASPTDVSSPRPHSPRQVALGLFILFQLAFLFVGNLLGFIRWGIPDSTDKPRRLCNRLAPDFPEQRGHGWRWAEEIDGGLRHWMELTGQEQDWSLFAPGVGKSTGFPAVLMLWDDPPPERPSLEPALLGFDEVNGFNLGAPWNPGPPELSMPAAAQLGVLGASSPWQALSLQVVNQVRAAAPLPRAEFLLSENEPADIDHFVRFRKPRFRRFEAHFYINTRPEEKESLEPYAARMTKDMQSLVSSNADAIVMYLKYRMAAWQREHPDQPTPKRVVLLQRFYRIHGPEEPRGWDGPMLVPCACWKPEAGGVVEYFDFSEQRLKR